jgi:hypothetical protein
MLTGVVSAPTTAQVPNRIIVAPTTITNLLDRDISTSWIDKEPCANEEAVSSAL